MKLRFFSLLILTVFLCNTAYAQSRIDSTRTTYSSILGKTKEWAVYLPPSYQSNPTDSFPVLYLLHGLGGNHTDWIRKGKVQATADSLLAIGAIEPLIIVMPDAERTYYMNRSNGSYSFEDYFIRELIPAVEFQYRIRSKRSERFIAGLSMGGHGALLYAWHHPHLFSVCAPLSAAIRTDKEIQNMPDSVFFERYGLAAGFIPQGENRITPFWQQNNTLYLAETLPEETLRSIRYYIDIGDDDYIFRGNSYLHILLSEREIPHEYRVRDGAHNWTYWRASLPSVLKFLHAE